MTRAYPVAEDGEWLRLASRFKLRCCDCSLVHWVEVRIVDGCTLMRFTRHTRATAATRRTKRRA